MVRVTLLPAGWSFAVAAGESVLEAALRNGITLPSSCRNGTCRSCVCRCVEGRVHYRVEWPGLSAEEQQQAWLLPCVALPDADLRLDAPRARREAPAVVPSHDAT